MKIKKDRLPDWFRHPEHSYNKNVMEKCRHVSRAVNLLRSLEGKHGIKTNEDLTTVISITNLTIRWLRSQWFRAVNKRDAELMDRIDTVLASMAIINDNLHRLKKLMNQNYNHKEVINDLRIGIIDDLIAAKVLIADL